MFDVNDTLIYGTQGVCTIVEKTQKKVGSNMVVYFVLKPVGKVNSTIFVPEDNEVLVGKMKSILSETELCKLIEDDTDIESFWIDGDNDRKRLFQSIITACDRKKLINLIRTLYSKKKHFQSIGKKIHQSDEKFMATAEKIICDELSYVMGVSLEEAIEYLHGKIRCEEV